MIFSTHHLISRLCFALSHGATSVSDGIFSTVRCSIPPPTWRSIHPNPIHLSTSVNTTVLHSSLDVFLFFFHSLAVMINLAPPSGPWSLTSDLSDPILINVELICWCLTHDARPSSEEISSCWTVRLCDSDIKGFCMNPREKWEFEFVSSLSVSQGRDRDVSKWPIGEHTHVGNPYNSTPLYNLFH